MIDLRTSWFHLLMRLEATGDWNEPFDDLVTRYSEPHRVYHNLDHLIEVVDTLEHLPPRAKPEEPLTTLFAMFYHDSIYRLGAHGNEAFSAVFAVFDARIMGVARRMPNLRYRVQATDHKNLARTYDDQLACDIDLLHLGKEWDEFSAKRELVRLEYLPVAANAGLSAATFAHKCADALDPFVKRRTIYQTPYFQENFEAQAQENLKRHISELRAA